MTRDLIPPQDLEAEMSLLGSMLLCGGEEANRLDDVLAVIGRGEAHHFYRTDHRMIFDAVVELHTNDIPIDLITVEGELRHRGELDRVGGRDYLIDLANSVPSVANGRYYARLVKEKSVLRSIIQAGMDMANAAYEATADSDEIMANAELALMKARGALADGAVVRLGDVAAEVVKSLESGDRSPGVTTPWSRINSKIGGLRGGQFIVLAARPSVGKTSFVLQLALHAATHHGLVAVFSLEMGREELAEQVLGMMALVDGRKLRALDEMSELELATIRAQRLPVGLLVDDRGGLSPEELRSRARLLVRRHGVCLVIVDYLQLMRAPSGSRTRSRYEAITEISRGIKLTARELNVPIVCTAQLNRDLEKDKRLPRLSDLRDSGAIEQDADVVAMLAEPEPTPVGKEPPATRSVLFLLQKQRRGEQGVVKMSFHAPTTTFREVGIADA